MSDQEKFDPDLMNAAGYVEKFPLEPKVIGHDLAEAKASDNNIKLSSSLSLVPTPRGGGFCVFRDGNLVNDLKDLQASDLKLIREYLDNPQTGNDLIPDE